MPFGGFKNFADCVAKNKDKDNPQAFCASIQSKVEGKKELKFNASKIKLKEEEKEFKSEGFIATTHPDRAEDSELGVAGDILSEGVIDKIVDVLNDPINSGHPEAKQVSYRHDWLKEDNPSLPPAGVNTSVEKRQTDDGHWGAYVNTDHNKNFPEKDNLVYDIEKGIIPGYSIEYASTDDEIVEHDGENYRFIKDIDFYGYGFANGRMIANPQAAIVAAGYKEMVSSFKKTKPEGKMKQTKEEKPAEEAPAEEKTEAQPETPKETPKEEIKEETPKEEPKEEPKDEAKEMATKVAKIALKEIADAKIKAEIKETKPEGGPALETGKKIEEKETKVEFKEYKDTFSREIPRDLSYKERSYLRSVKTADLWSASGRLHTQLKEKGAKFLPGIQSEESGTSFEIKENRIQYKGLAVETNYVGAQTTYPAILNNYEQTPAELNDIYGPAIINQMNDEVATWNKLTKVDGSSMSAIRIRARTNVVAGDETSPQNFGSTPNFNGNVTRRKYNAWFVTRYADVKVEDEEIQLAKATGGVGDIFAIEIRDRTKDLLTQVNKDLLTGDNTHPTAENVSYRFQNLIRTSGDLYGKTVTDTKDNKLAAAGVDDMSSAPITLKKLREMIDASLDNGASVNDLAFFGSRTQRTKIVTLIQALQRTVPTSGRVGFEEQIVIDQGVPYFPDKDADTDDIYLIDTVKTKVTIKVAPTFVEFAKVSLHRKGIVWMMYNITSDNPNHNYWIFGLQTT